MLLTQQGVFPSYEEADARAAVVHQEVYAGDPEVAVIVVDETGAPASRPAPPPAPAEVLGDWDF